MIKRTLITAACLIGLATAANAGGSKEIVLERPSAASTTPMTVTVTPGEHYLHRLKVMPLVSVRNAPQMVVWTETREGEFLETLFITNRIATQQWRGAPGDATPTDDIRRVEALPVWSHRHGRIYADGLPVPTQEEPMPDAVTAATPKEGFTLRTEIPDGRDEIVVYFEVNASTDFNDAYPEDAAPGDANYSGGEWGSGQPSLVYRGVIDSKTSEHLSLELVGHGSADGSAGAISPDLSGITTARSIIQSVTVTGSDGFRG